MTIRPLHEVAEIREDAGRFEVRCQQRERIYTSDFLFLAMGTLQSTSLLLTAKAKGWLPRLGPEVGKGFGNNDDATAGAGKVYWPYGPMETKGDKAARDFATRLWWETSGCKGRLLEGVPSYDLGADKMWHPLGGMVMGKATDLHGRSVDYPNLYCAWTVPYPR